MLLVYSTIWTALLFYTIAVAWLAFEPRPSSWPRNFWTVGCVLFVIHVVSVFAFIHNWSHDHAMAHTRSETMKLTGVDSGSGLYLNYLFALIWLADTIWWWIVGKNRYRQRSRLIFGLIHFYFLFMIFNGAFLFVESPRRWLGLLLTAVGFGSVVRTLLQKSRRDVRSSEPQS
ncbi:MAG: hypothetical protein ACI8UO_005540 [Verrucomicrobiales bacterium]|jgi:hypothetical protein